MTILLVEDNIVNQKLALKLLEKMDFNADVAGNPIGYYFMVSYRFNKWFEFGSYYSESYGNRADKKGESDVYTENYEAWRKDIALTGRWDLNTRWTAKVETHFINGTAGLYKMDNPTGTEQHWSLYAIKISYLF